MKRQLEENIYFSLGTEQEKEELLSLYRSVIGSEGCTWSQEYPSEAILEGDVKRRAVFVMKNQKGEILGAISIDDDKEVDGLSCWSNSLKPAAELARVVVKEEYQNQGIARRMFCEVMKELRKRGYKGVHYLVSKQNERALRSYAKLSFEKVGECDLYGGDWWCYEREL